MQNIKFNKIGIKIFSFKIYAVAFLLIVPRVAFLTGGPDPAGSGKLTNPLGSTTNLVEFINQIISNVVIPIGAVVVVFFIIFSGFLFVTASGNEEKLKTAKKTLLWTIIGSAILLGALAISTAIENTIEAIKG